MSAVPKRIQRRRSKGWRMPAGAVYVGRPSKWGNPFVPAERFGNERSLDLFRQTAQGFWTESLTDGLPSVAATYDSHHAWLKRMGEHPVDAARRELSGKDLACWCPLDRPCHADVLLEIANS